MYCSELKNLTICGVSISPEILNILRPALRGLQKLEFADCYWRDEDMRTLHRTVPLLCELKIQYSGGRDEEVNRFQSLCHSFPNLLSISLRCLNVTRDDVLQFLKLNQKIEKIELIGCDQLESGVLCEIAEMVPYITSLRYCLSWNEGYEDFGRLRYLTSLTLHGSIVDVASVVGVIGSFGIALENLRCDLEWHSSTNIQLVDTICELNTLKTLRLNSCNFFFNRHILKICKKLGDLTQLHLSYDNRMPNNVEEHDWSGENLLELVKSAKKLKVFKFRWNSDQRFSINVDIFMEMMSAVEKRRDKMHLHLDLPMIFTVNVPMPTEAHNNLLTVTTDNGWL